MKKHLIITGIFLSILFVGCATHVHTVGTGPQIGQVETATQWYALYGLIPLNTVDTAAMAGGAANYEIQTQLAPLDIIIGGITSYVTVNRRTVTVTK